MEGRAAFVITLPDEILRERLVPFLSYRELFNFSLTRKTWQDQFNKRVIGMLNRECEKTFPLPLLNCCLLTGGFLLSVLTGKKFQSPIADLVIDYDPDRYIDSPTNQLIFEAGVILTARQTLLQAGWTRVEPEYKLGVRGIYSKCEKYQRGLEEVHLYIPFSGELASDLVDSHSLSISRMWFDGEQLSVFDMENSLNLQNHGYKAFIMDYEAQKDEDQALILATEKLTSTQQSKYLLRGYLVGLFEEEEEEEETLTLVPGQTHGPVLLNDA